MSNEIEFTIGDWAVFSSYGGHTAGRVEAVTAQTIRVAERFGGYGSGRPFKEHVLVTVATREAAGRILDQLKSAVAEEQRQTRAARDWLRARVAEIVADALASQSEPSA